MLNIFNLPPLGGEEGSRRVQTLNMVNAAKADEYQGVGDEPTKKENEQNAIETEEEEEV